MKWRGLGGSLWKGRSALFYDIVGVAIESMQWELLCWLGWRGCQILFKLYNSACCQAAMQHANTAFGAFIESTHLLRSIQASYQFQQNS